MTRLSKAEKETIFLTSEADTTGELFTYSKALIKRLEKLCDMFPEMFYKKNDNGSGGLTFVFPKKYFKVATPRILSKEQKQQAVENLHK